MTFVVLALFGSTLVGIVLVGIVRVVIAFVGIAPVGIGTVGITLVGIGTCTHSTLRLFFSRQKYVYYFSMVLTTRVYILNSLNNLNSNCFIEAESFV